MKKNKEIVELVNQFSLVYEKYSKLHKEVNKEIEYWSDETNWSKKSFREDEEYGMRLWIMKDLLRTIEVTQRD